MATLKPKFKSKYDYSPSQGLKCKKESNVIEQDSCTVREMLIKHANGTVFDNLQTPFYEEQATFTSKSLNKIQDMDLTDKLIYLNEVTEEAAALSNKIAEHKAEQDALSLANEQAQQSEASTTATTEP